MRESTYSAQPIYLAPRHQMNVLHFLELLHEATDLLPKSSHVHGPVIALCKGHDSPEPEPEPEQLGTIQGSLTATSLGCSQFWGDTCTQPVAAGTALCLEVRNKECGDRSGQRGQQAPNTAPHPNT